MLKRVQPWEQDELYTNLSMDCTVNVHTYTLGKTCHTGNTSEVIVQINSAEYK